MVAGSCFNGCKKNATIQWEWGRAVNRELEVFISEIIISGGGVG
jgi:hypothetical protein